MAAREDKAQAVIRLARLIRHERSLQDRELLQVAPVAPEDVDGPPPGGGHQPRARLVRNALDRPSLERRHQAVLHDLLGAVEVAAEPQQGRSQPPRLLAEDRDDRCVGGGTRLPQLSVCSTTGRTSTMLPPGQLLAMAKASSRSLTTSTAKPPRTSLDSMNGPSVTVVLPFLRRTVVAVLGPCSSSPPTIFPDLLCSSNHWPIRW